METSAVCDQIKVCLTQNFKPAFIEVEDDSARHQGHREAGAGGGSHFRIKMAAEFFNGLSLIKRHQAVYQTLESFLQSGVHALQMELLSAEEWHARGPG